MHASILASESVDDSTPFSLQWDMTHVLASKEMKRFSEPFTIGGYPWYTFAALSRTVDTAELLH